MNWYGRWKMSKREKPRFCLAHLRKHGRTDEGGRWWPEPPAEKFDGNYVLWRPICRFFSVGAAGERAGRRSLHLSSAQVKCMAHWALLQWGKISANGRSQCTTEPNRISSGWGLGFVEGEYELTLPASDRRNLSENQSRVREFTNDEVATLPS